VQLKSVKTRQSTVDRDARKKNLFRVDESFILVKLTVKNF